MASFQKRGDAWRAIVRKGGVFRSRTFQRKADAVAWATGEEAGIRAHDEGRIPDKTFADLLTRYRDEVSAGKKGARWESIRIAAFLRDPLAGKRLSALNSDALADWRNRRLAVVSAATVLRELGLLSSICNYAVREWRWLSQNPVSGIRRPAAPPPRDRRVSDDEIERLLHVLGYRYDAPPETKTARVGAAFLFAIETAMRCGEITGLTADDVDLSARVARIGGGKTAAARRDVPLSTEAVRLIRQLPPSPELFALDSGTVDALFRKARGKAGIVDLHFHDTRHEAITRLARKLDVLALARMVGHRDLSMLQVYYNATAEELAARLD